MVSRVLDDYTQRLLQLGVLLILVLVPFHAFLTVWIGSATGHYTLVRLWEEVLLAVMMPAALYLTWRDKLWRKLTKKTWLVWLIGLYLIVQVVWLLVALQHGSVNLKAGLYGLVINSRFLVFFGLAWLAARNDEFLLHFWRQIVLIPAAIVVLFGLLQRFVLPHDVLRHFGYSQATIAPFETIDHKVQYLRIQSTLRGANLLGAYLVLVLSVVISGLRHYYRWLGLVAGITVLFLSGSRAAWIGAVLALSVLVWLRLPNRRTRQWVVVGAGLFTAVLVVGVFALRNQDFVQNTVFHTDENSSSSVSSNAAHLSATCGALKQVIEEPLGRGVGTAGPASVYNTKEPSRIAENYFLQLGQETGWLGLGLFVAICVLMARALWLRRLSPLAQVLLAGFIGINLVALLMHLWTDETASFLWWGLAGVALAPTITNRSKYDTKPLL
jgi:hypothetical protein